MDLSKDTAQNDSELSFSKTNSKAVIANHLAGEDILPPEIQEENRLLDELSSKVLLESNLESNLPAGFGLVSRARSVVTRLETLLQTVTKHLEEEIELARQRVNRMASICGLALLPAEILERIFLFVVREAADSSGPSQYPIAAVYLSHVCNRFRRTALSFPPLWSVISVGDDPSPPELDLVRACIERSKNCPLDVHLHFHGDWYYAFDGVALMALSQVHRWRYLQVDSSDAGYKYIDDSEDVLSEEVFGGTQDAPLLEHIALPDSSKYVGSIDDMSLFSTWNLPSLRKLTLTQHRPTSLLDLSTITTLDYSAPWDVDADLEYYLKDLVNALERMPSLSDLHINLEAVQAYNEKFPKRPEVVLRSVQTLRIDYPAFCTSKYEHTYPFCRTFFSTLSVPNAVELYVGFNGEPSDDKEDEVIDVREVLQNFFETHDLSKMEKCHIEVNLEAKRDIPGYPGFHPTTLPITFPPNISELIVKCNTSPTWSSDTIHKVAALPKLGLATLDVGQVKKTDSREIAKWADWLLHSCNCQCEGRNVVFERVHIFERDVDGHRKGPVDGKSLSRRDLLRWHYDYKFENQT